MLITITFLNVQSLEGLIRHDQFLSPKDPLEVGLRAGTWPEFKIFAFLKGYLHYQNNNFSICAI